MSDRAHFLDQFIDDYYSECEEHLATVRRVLLVFEDAAVGADVEPARQELSRALHTLKGLSGMVGLVEAERVAHAMEDAARLMQRSVAVPPELLELLFTGANVIEASIAAHRAHVPIPDDTPYVDRVRQLVQRMGARREERVEDASRAPLSGGDASGPLATYRFAFTPTPALAQRGVGVEAVRRRLAELGTITSTIPRVLPQGGVVFEFGLSVRAGAAPPEEWRADGLTWQRLEIAPAPIAEAPDRASTFAVVAPGERRAPAAHAVASNVVRVDLARVDDLMRMVGDMVVTRARLNDALDRANALTTVTGARHSSEYDDLVAANETLERQIRAIREGVMRIRLVPIGEVFERMRFAMRDIARDTRKSIHLDFEGQDTEIDKVVVDRMLEPLLHLVRNSASHGIEAPSVREAAGKPAYGTIRLCARAAGDRIVLEVEDDGAGIDARGVARRGAELGLVHAGEALGDDGLLDLLCSPGLSTREAADMASGRGVGMAVVRTTVRALGGELYVHSVLGQGTRFTVELPLTLMIADALMFEIGDQAMAIPQVSLREIVPLDTSAVTRFENNEVMSYRGSVLPLVNLGETFNFPPRPGASRHVLVVGSDANMAGLLVDRLLGLREIVVHPVADPLIATPGLAGATEMADGRVSLILDAAALVRGTRDRASRARARRLEPSAHASTALGAGTEDSWA